MNLRPRCLACRPLINIQLQLGESPPALLSNRLNGFFPNHFADLIP
jgi:hypothetical protein